MKIKKANVKLLFKGEKVNEIIFGDFGTIEVPDKEPLKEKDWKSCGDCLLAWPINPEFTGKSGIIDILNLPVTALCFRNF